MIKQLQLLLLLSIGVLSLKGQEYNIISGPSYFMRLNEAATDFENIEMGTLEQGYTFYHSYWDPECPWSVVSEEEGTNIYTKLNLGKVSDINKVFMLTPNVDLSTSGSYTYNQHIFGIANETEVPVALTRVELKLLKGNVEDFQADLLTGVPSLALYTYRETGNALLLAEGIVPQSNGSHYFVLCVTSFNVYAGNTTGMSLGFKHNTIVDYASTGINTSKSATFKVHPNPSKGIINIGGYKGKLEVRDILGNLVYQLSDYNGQQIDLSHLNRGIYLLGYSGQFVRFVKN